MDGLQVIALLKEDRAFAPIQIAEDCLGYSSLQTMCCAACIGTYLIDLLHMRSLQLSPMSAADPDVFLRACQGGNAECEGLV